METANSFSISHSLGLNFKKPMFALLLTALGCLNAQTTTPPRELIRFKLESTNFSDQTVLYMQENATLAFDSKYDAYKFINPSINIYTVPVENLKLSINAISNTLDEELIPIHFSTKETGLHHLRITQHINPEMYAESFLIDTYTGANIPILLNQVYDFEINKEDSARIVSDRFLIHLQGKRSSIVTSQKEQSFGSEAEISPNPVTNYDHLKVHLAHHNSEQVSIEIDNALGKEVNHVDVPYSEEIDLDYTQSLDAGVYFIHIKQGKDINICERILKK